MSSKIPKKKIIITGGCGFIGSHVVEHFFIHTDWDIIIIDKLSYASKGFERLRDTATLDSPRVNVFCYDLVNKISEGLKYEMGNIDCIVHMAAETHVDNSIADPELFIHNNIMSTFNLLELARSLPNLKTFFYFSTDEVFGPAPYPTSYKEWDRHRPTNPYSASKSAAENLCVAYENTYKVPVIIVNVMNAFGERQHPEKFIPNTIKKVLAGETIQIHTYADKKTTGSRFYIHARNIASAVLFLLNNGEIGEKYNIVGEKEVDNLEMAQFIAKTLKKELKYELIDFHTKRPGHDTRYALNGEKLVNMGWTIPVPFEDSLRKTIEWTIDNPQWMDFDSF